MVFTVTIAPSGKQFSPLEDEPILDAALRNGLLLPYNCRSGNCGKCKAKVTQGTVDSGVYNETTLSEKEHADGYSLLCQATALTDVTIEVLELRQSTGVEIKKLPCRINKIERLAEDVIRLYIKLPASQRLDYVAGQYLDFILQDGRHRSFSIANTPSHDELVELHVRHVPGGEFTQHIFEDMKEKDLLRIEGPYGQFYLQEKSTRPMILMAGGTGFAPIKAVIERAFELGFSQPIYLYWGVRSKKDLYLHDLAVSWLARDNFHYIPVLSEPRESDEWADGRVGFVHEAILQDHPDMHSYDVYACGPPVMVKAGQKAFVEARLPADAMFSDAFEFAPR